MWIRTRSDLGSAPLAVAIALALLGASAPARAEDPMAQYRDRFKQGLERYNAGAVAEAIQFWEPIYRELGREKGYRLAYNLAVAYDSFGDVARAAERYDGFLSEVSSRRARGEVLPAIVTKEEEEARAKLQRLTAANARVEVRAGDAPTVVQIDGGEPRIAGFVVYVRPGTHTFTFGTGDKAERREVTAGAGESLELQPPASPTPTPAPSPPPPIPPATVTPPPPPAKPVVVRTREAPFSPVVLYVAFGAALVSVVAPVIAYSDALSLHDEYPKASGDRRAAIERDYGGSRTLAYATLAIPISLAAATAGLATWYFLGTKERTTIVPAAAAQPGGAWLGATGRFD